MTLINTDSLKTGIEDSVTDFLAQRDLKSDELFEINRDKVPQLLIELLNRLIQTVLEWGGHENRPVMTRAYLGRLAISHLWAGPGQMNYDLEKSVAGFAGFQPIRAYAASQLCISTYRPEENSAHLDLAGASIAHTRQVLIKGRPPLEESSHYYLVVRQPCVSDQSDQVVFPVKLVKDKKSEQERVDVDRRRATASKRESIDAAKALEGKGLQRPYPGGAPEMGKLSKR